MTIPDYISVLPSGDWVLARDEGIAVLAHRAGRLDWQEWFAELPEVQALFTGKIAVDVGAFVGDTARALSRTGARVLAFEPQCDAFRCLTHNCPECECFHVALGDNRPLSIAGGEGGNMGARWTAPAGLRGGRFGWGFPLDGFELDGLDFLKIDVEGFEPAVLAGARKTIAKYHPTICIEINDQALLRNGYLYEDVMGHLKGYRTRTAHKGGEPGLYDLVCTWEGNG